MNASAKKANEATKKPEPTPIEKAAQVATLYGDHAKEEAAAERASILKEWRWVAERMMETIAATEKDSTRSFYGIGEAACRLEQLKERAVKMEAKAESIRRLQDIIDALAEATPAKPRWTCPDCAAIGSDFHGRGDGSIECTQCGAIVGPKELEGK
ncbi:MAG: hypothetical protein HY292_07790 [Planctomycetes bacterium]|nr:hypothetical protein [Planctomycetota bacterium]